MINSKHKDILILSIIGDALGSTYDGLSRGHIKSNPGSLNDYFDPHGKKIDSEKWRKPGLYTSLSQLMIYTLFSIEKSIFKPDLFIKNIKESQKIDESGIGIFRHASNIEKFFLEKTFNPSIESITAARPSARILPLVIPLSLYGISMENLITSTIEIISLLKGDYLTISAALLLALLINYLIINDDQELNDLLRLSLELNIKLEETLADNSPLLFKMKVNPDMLLASTRTYTELLSELSNEKDFTKGEMIIYSKLNKKLKTSVKKATIDNPLAILPYSLFLVKNYIHLSGNSLISIAKEGGSSSALTSISGAVFGCYSESLSVPLPLFENLVNKKKIDTIINSILSDKISGELINDFSNSESRLTIKEIQEYRAKQKKNKGKIKNKRDNESDLSKHIVESWTKLDKAKWRKSINIRDYDENS